MNTKLLVHSLRRIGVQVRKELLLMFATPVAYIVTVLFVGISEFLFFKNVFLVGEASLALYYQVLPWVLLFVVPALTMGLFAQEREQGTYEILATQPLSETETVVSKCVAVIIYLAAALSLAVFPIAICFSFFSNLDWGAVWGGYLAGVWLIALFVALGSALSSLFTKQVPALLSTIAVLFFLTIAGTDLVAGTMPVALTLFFERLSVISHFGSMARGVIDVRDLWYFASGVIAALAFARYRLMVLRFGRTHEVRTRARVSTAIVVLTVLISNMLGSAIPGRIDLTADQVYTVSDATKELVRSVPDIVTITLYASAALPAPLQPTLRDVRDLLGDIERYSGGNVTFTVKDPSADASSKEEAEAQNVHAVQFNVMGQGELSVKQGYLGVVLSYAGEHRSIPFIEQTNDLEYQLASMISDLTMTERKHVAFLTGHGEKSSYEYGGFVRELSKHYIIDDLTVDPQTGAPSATSTDVLVIAGPTMPLGTTTKQFLTRFVDRGGAVLALVPGVTTNVQTLSATNNPTDFIGWLSQYGVTVNQHLVYDLRSNETVQLGGGGMLYLLPYPYWVRAGLVQQNPIASTIESVMFPWASAITTNTDVLNTSGQSATPLVVTSRYAGIATEPYNIEPNQELPTDDLQERTLALSLSPTNATGSRMVIMGNADFLIDDVAQHNVGNLALGMSAVSWLAQEDSLAAIKVKSGQRRTFVFESAGMQSVAAYAPMAFGILVPILVGGIFFYLRRKKSTEIYRPSSSM